MPLVWAESLLNVVHFLLGEKVAEKGLKLGGGEEVFGGVVAHGAGLVLVEEGSGCGRACFALKLRQLLERLKTLSEEDQLKQQPKTSVKSCGVILRPKGKYLDGKRRWAAVETRPAAPLPEPRCAAL